MVQEGSRAILEAPGLHFGRIFGTFSSLGALLEALGPLLGPLCANVVIFDQI